MAKVPGMTRRAKVAPFNACVVCYGGDTTTGLAFSGQAEFIIAGLSKLLPSIEEATATAGAMFGEQGFDRGKVPVGRVETFVRLCRDCARAKGIPDEAVIEEREARTGEPVPGYYQHDDDADEGLADIASLN